MSKMNRRGVLRLAATAAGANALLPACAIGDGRGEQGQAADAQDDRWAKEREHVMSVGFTEAEAACWELAARVVGSFFDLPELHEMDGQEVAQAIHVIQNKLMSRPTYRRYRELDRSE